MWEHPDKTVRTKSGLQLQAVAHELFVVGKGDFEATILVNNNPSVASLFLVGLYSYSSKHVV